MAASTGLGDLKTSEWQELQQIADRFEKAWQKVADQGEPPDLARFLPPPQDPLRKLVLQELIKTDLEARWRRNLSTGIEFYLQRFAELGKAKELPASLLYEEYRIRQYHGDRPPVTAYQRRFPDQFDEFQRLVNDEPMATNLVTITAPPPPPPPTAEKAKPTSASTGTASSVGRMLGVTGEYSLLERIGSGSFGEVWRALAPGGIPCAVKVLTRPVDHETAQRELESLEIIKNIRHPFLLQTQTFSVSEERLYIIMELADGSLRSRLKECRKEGHNGIPLKELIPYFQESAEALDFLHSKKIQHRDVKPDNILLLERHVKVADFGLAKLQGERSLVTATSSGTPAYMGPEVWSGKFSEHSDQYALAFTYAELRLDRRVCPGVSLPEMMNDHLNTTPDLEPMPEAEKEVVLRAMSKDPAKRFPSCKEFVQALDLATRKERGVSMTVPEGTALSEAPTADNSQGGTDPWSTMAGVMPPTLKPGQSAAGRTVPWKPPTVSKWPLFAGMAVALLAIVAMGVYSWKHPKGAGGESDPAENLPTGFVAVGTETVEDLYKKKYFKQIVRVFDGGLEAKFVCIPKQKEYLTETIPDPETYYIMVDKVSVGLFQKFANKKEIPGDWKKHDDPNNEKLPVMNVLPLEAFEFAQDMFGKNCNLPKKIQWQKATGYFLKSGKLEGPFVGNWNRTTPLNIVLSPKYPLEIRKSPLEIGSGRDDVSPYECRDMAGNGLEWLRNVVGQGEHFLPHVTGGDHVVVWGKSFVDPDPFLFEEDIERPGAKPYIERNFDVGFRVVIETVDSNK